MDLGNGDAHLAGGAGSRRRGRRSLVHARRRRQRREQPARAARRRRLRRNASATTRSPTHVRGLLRSEQVDDSGVFTLADRPTTRKTRVVAHNQQVVRADWESTAPPSARERPRLAAFVRERAARVRRRDSQRLRKGVALPRDRRSGRGLPARSRRSQAAERRTLRRRHLRRAQRRRGRADHRHADTSTTRAWNAPACG